MKWLLLLWLAWLLWVLLPIPLAIARGLWALFNDYLTDRTPKGSS